MSNGLMRMAIYGRQSQDNDRSIDEQLDLGRERCGEEGWTEAGIYSDGVSASRHAAKKRDDWPRLLAAVEAGEVDVIWLWESSRGDRTLSSWAALLESCQRHGTRLFVETHDRLYDMNVPRDWKTMAEEGVDSAYESDKTALRVRRSAAKMAAEGRPHGRVVYGYRREYAWETRRGRRVWVMQAQVPDPDEALVVREIIARIAGGESLRAVTMDLNDRGVRTRKGGKWTSSSVRDTAMNVAYIGKRIHDPVRKGGRATEGAVVHDAAWPPLVDETTFYDARRILADPKRKTSRPGGAKHLLSLIARCGVCGGPMTVSYPKTNGRRATYKCRSGNCVQIERDSLDERVLVKVAARLADEGNWRRLRAAGPSGDAGLEAARARRDKIEADYDETVSLFDAGKISPAAFARVEPGKLSRLEQARAEVAKLETPPALRVLGDGPADEAVARLIAAPLSAQRAVIRALVSVTVNKAPSRGHRVEAARRTRIEPIL